MELKFDREKNLEERLKFVHYYARWVKEVPNEVWSRQQAKLINSFMLNASNFKMTREAYLKMKEQKLRTANKA
ncbi:MAG: hypothetical protein ACXQTP_05110 [Candidatus Methanofastidiosia archaeon]